MTPLAICVALALLACTATALARPQVEKAGRDGIGADAWKTVAASGRVENQPAGVDASWVDVRRGDALEPLSALRTGNRGRATLTRQASVMIVDPHSHLQLPDGEPVDATNRVVQRSGTVIYEVERKDGRQFEVVTPYLVAGVKGTVFGVTVSDGYTLLSVEEGIVEVRSPEGDAMDIHAGEAVRVHAERGDVEILRRERRDRAGRTPQTRKLARKRHHRLTEVTERLDAKERLDDESALAADNSLDDDPLRDKDSETGLFDEDPVASLDDEKQEGMDDLDDRDDDVFDSRDEIQQIKESQRKATNQTTSGGSN
jgi:hypothetical protein